jgi:hypothetical protein
MHTLLVAVLLILASLGIVSADSSWSTKHPVVSSWSTKKTAYGGQYFLMPSDFAHCPCRPV